MKSVISIILVIAALTLCFCGCSNVPSEPATTAVEYYSYVDPYAETATPPVNNPDADNKTQYLETIENIEFVMSSYYVDGNSCAKITNIDFMTDILADTTGLATIEVISKGLGQEYMRIGYTAYDADGKILKNVFLQGKLDGVGKGETCEEAPFEIPDGTVKVVFFDYVEK